MVNDMSQEVDFILICQSEVVDYEQFSQFSRDRIELFSDLVFPRMVYYRGGLRSHLDLFNFFEFGTSYQDARPSSRRNMCNIWNLPSLSGIHLANYLYSQEISTKVINNFDSEFDLIEEAYRSAVRKPLIGISSTFYLGFREISRITKFLYSLDQDVRIVVGGAFANSLQINSEEKKIERNMRKHGVHYFLHAFNSETDLVSLIRKIRKRECLSSVNNLIYFQDDDPIDGPCRQTAVAWNEPVLNKTPINWSQLELPFVASTVQTRTVSGCPFSCAFCSYPTTAGGHHLMDIDAYEQHLISLLQIQGVKRLVFIDDTFNVPPRRFKKLLKMFMKYEFEWFSFLRCQYLDEEQAKMMKESGCQGVYLGVESANDTVLRNMNKRVTREKFVRGANLLTKHQIPKMVAFVLGFPGETESTLRDNRTFLQEVQAEFYTLKEFFYTKQTLVYEQREKFGLTGIGNNWAHDTMDSVQATRNRQEMFLEINDSIHVDPDISLWHWIYLSDRGYTLSQVKEIQRYTNEVVKDQMTGTFDDPHPAFTQIKKIVEQKLN
jgi:anaerobic magnesium-protoporphyrin IX monomethyl ester cyclase